MIYTYEEMDENNYTRHFKTLAGAQAHGCLRLRNQADVVCFSSESIISPGKPYQRRQHYTWQHIPKFGKRIELARVWT